MSDQPVGGFGAAGTALLPPRIQRLVAASDAADARAARQAEKDRAAEAEAWRERNLSLYRSQAAARGEDVTALELVTAGGIGRSIADVFADAAAAAEREDARQRARLVRAGEPVEAVHYFASEPVIRKPVSRNELFIRKLVARFKAGHPQADAVQIAMFRQAAARAAAKEIG